MNSDIKINNGGKKCPKCGGILIPVHNPKGVRYLKCKNAFTDVKKCDYVVSDLKEQKKEWGV